MFLEEFILYRHVGDTISLTAFTFNNLTQGGEGDPMRARNTQSNRNMEIEAGRLQDQRINKWMHINLRDRKDLTHRPRTEMSTAI